MLVNYPLECWDIDTIVNTMAPYGRFLVWNRQDSNKARIFVKIRAYDINKIPGSIVVLHNTDSLGHGNSWSCPCVLFNMQMIGAGPGDEDPLLPDGGNPHPQPLVFDDFDIWHAQNEGNFPAAPAQPAPANINPDEPVLMTPENSPGHNNAANVEDAVMYDDAAIPDFDVAPPAEHAAENIVAAHVHPPTAAVADNVPVENSKEQTGIDDTNVTLGLVDNHENSQLAAV
jgi:hypothetical protein